MCKLKQQILNILTTNINLSRATNRVKFNLGKSLGSTSRFKVNL